MLFLAMYTFVIVTMRLCGQRNTSPKIKQRNDTNPQTHTCRPSFFFGVRIRFGTILGRFSIIYFRGLGLRIGVRARVRVRVWVRVSVVLWSW